MIVSVITSRFSAVCACDRIENTTTDTIRRQLPSYNFRLAPGSNFRELDLPNLATAPVRLHPGFFWLGYHLLCVLSTATDHRLGIDSRLFVLHPDGHLPEAPPFHYDNLSGAFPPPRGSSYPWTAHICQVDCHLAALTNLMTHLSLRKLIRTPFIDIQPPTGVAST